MGWSLSRALDQEADQQAECSDGERNQNAPEQRRRVWFHLPRPSMGNEPNTQKERAIGSRRNYRPECNVAEGPTSRQRPHDRHVPARSVCASCAGARAFDAFMAAPGLLTKDWISMRPPARCPNGQSDVRLHRRHDRSLFALGIPSGFFHWEFPL
jgi:hypothetical protein